MHRLFISDLHLDADRPESLALFEGFLDRHAAQADELYILGDFLEYWLGDDDDPGGLRPCLQGLARLAEGGCHVRLMHGNRDFLIGEGFARRYGIGLLDDPHRLELDGRPCLLMHGDTLCTDDLPYQAFRAQVRSPQWQQRFLEQSLAARRAQVRDLRRRSREATHEKAPQIMDVNAEAVLRTLREHAVRSLIHGHTHRPGLQRFDLDGAPAWRLVLGDWYHSGSFARQMDDRLQLFRLNPDTSAHEQAAVELA